MARMTIEGKLVQQMVSAVCDVRMNRYHFSQIAMEQPAGVRRLLFDLCCAYIEMYAIKRDFGAFEPDEAHFMPLVHKMRNLIVEASQQGEWDPHEQTYSDVTY
jgi:hypothetical protein